jgi:hypothetical protein
MSGETRRKAGSTETYLTNRWQAKVRGSFSQKSWPGIVILSRPPYGVGVGGPRSNGPAPQLFNAMSKKKTKSRRQAKSAHVDRQTGETNAGDATTVAWTISVTMVLMCNIAAVAAHFYMEMYRETRGLVMLKELMLIAGAIVGFLSLVLLPIMLRIRRVPPPTGVVVFAVCAAAAPILALLVHSTR